MSNSTYAPKIYRRAGGNEMVIADDGSLYREDSAGTEAAEPQIGLPGAVVAATGSVVEYGDAFIHKTVITLALSGSNDLDLAGDADNSIGVKVYDMPAGRLFILGAMIDCSVVCNDAFNASTNDIFYLAVGSADGTQAANGDLTSTEADIIPKATIDTVSNTTLTNDWHSALATAAQWDGTSAAIDVYVNAAVANASTTKAVTIAITGTLTLYWINLGDY